MYVSNYEKTRKVFISKLDNKTFKLSLRMHIARLRTYLWVYASVKSIFQNHFQSQVQKQIRVWRLVLQSHMTSLKSLWVAVIEWYPLCLRFASIECFWVSIENSFWCQIWITYDKFLKGICTNNIFVVVCKRFRMATDSNR